MSHASAALAEDLTGATYSIITPGISSGGNSVISDSGSYQGNITLGQSTPLMDQNALPAPPESTSHSLYPGFQYAAAGIKNCFGDQPPNDSDVDGVDLVSYLATGDFSTMNSFAASFGNICW